MEFYCWHGVTITLVQIELIARAMTNMMHIAYAYKIAVMMRINCLPPSPMASFDSFVETDFKTC